MKFFGAIFVGERFVQLIDGDVAPSAVASFNNCGDEGEYMGDQGRVS